MKIINCEQGTEEWLTCRIGKLTASTAHTIACDGKGLETLCLEKVTEILTQKPTESFKSEAMQHGNDYEDEARNIYELETGNIVSQVGFIEQDEFVGVSPDGLIGDDGLIEIKCPTDKTYTQYLLDGKIKPEYYSQMNMQMLVTGRTWCDYVVYNPNFFKSIVIKRVIIDEDEIDKIKKGLESGKNKIKTMLEALKDVK